MKRIHIPCADIGGEDCGSSDGASISVNDKGETWGKCFVCNKNRRQDGPEGKGTQVKVSVSAEDMAKLRAGAAPKSFAPSGPGSPVVSGKVRGIPAAALRHYSVTYMSPEAAQDPAVTEGWYGFPYSDTGVYKLRTLESKKFSWLGKAADGEALWGMSKFAPSGKKIVITEGEMDAMAAYAMQGLKYPVVSLKNGAVAALKDCTAAYDWLMGFEEIVINFDTDEPGVKAAKDVGELFGRKALIMPPGALKDANAYLEAGKEAEWVKLFWAAKPYSPEGLKGISDLRTEILKGPPQPIATFPLPELQRILKGIFAKRLYTVTMGSGLGKSTLMRWLAYHLWLTTKEKIGLMFLEESGEETARYLVGQYLGIAMNQPDTVVDQSKLLAGLDVLEKGDRFVIWDHFDSVDSDTVLKRLEYMVRVEGVKFAILDHISIVISGHAQVDERKTIDETMTKLRLFVEATGCTLFVVSHLSRNKDSPHEEGGKVSPAHLRGSGGIFQLSDVVISGERDSQGDDEDAGSVVRYRVMKNRPTAKTGPAGAAKYDYFTDSLSPYVEAPL